MKRTERVLCRIVGVHVRTVVHALSPKEERKEKERKEEILANGPANGFHFVSECLRYKVVRALVFHARAAIVYKTEF